MSGGKQERIANICCGHAACQREVQASVDGAVAGTMDGFADYLMVKAENAEGAVEGTYSDGMRNAAVDAGLWLSIRDHWRDGLEPVRGPNTKEQNIAFRKQWDERVDAGKDASPWVGEERP